MFQVSVKESIVQPKSQWCKNSPDGLQTAVSVTIRLGHWDIWAGCGLCWVKQLEPGAPPLQGPAPYVTGAGPREIGVPRKLGPPGAREAWRRQRLLLRRLLAPALLTRSWAAEKSVLFCFAKTNGWLGSITHPALWIPARFSSGTLGSVVTMLWWAPREGQVRETRLSRPRPASAHSQPSCASG